MLSRVHVWKSLYSEYRLQIQPGCWMMMSDSTTHQYGTGWLTLLPAVVSLGGWIDQHVCSLAFTINSSSWNKPTLPLEFKLRLFSCIPRHGTHYKYPLVSLCVPVASLKRGEPQPGCGVVLLCLPAWQKQSLWSTKWQRKKQKKQLLFSSSTGRYLMTSECPHGHMYTHSQREWTRKERNKQGEQAWRRTAAWNPGANFLLWQPRCE